jgi:Tfp pilus assembly PilM family ATPase
MTQRLPLGIDIGTSRLRMVAMCRERDGAVRVESTATRDFPNADRSSESATISSAIAESIAEIGGRRRTCVLALPWNEAMMRCIEFPPMRTSERLRAARLESAMFAPWGDKATPTQVRVQSIDGASAHLIVVAPWAAIHTRMRAVSDTRLAVLAMDYEPLALRRSFPNADAILDIGFRQSRLYGRWARSSRTLSIDGGGAEITAAIASALSIDIGRAERRKRSVGAAGACDRELDDFVRRIREAVEALRERATVRTLGITGNGWRIPGLVERVVAAASVSVELPARLSEDTYSACPSFAFDYALAASLASWTLE